MVITLTVILGLAALICAIASWGWQKPPLALAVILLAILALLKSIPIGQ